MKRKIICLLIGFIAFGTSSSQNKIDDSLCKRIPVIRYVPTHFTASIEDAFVHSPEYLDIHIKNGDTLYTKNRYGETYKPLKSDFFKRNDIDTKLFWEKDSIFFVYINEYLYRSDIPIYRIYGTKKNGKFEFSYTHGREKLYSFSDFIKLQYGSVSKFQETYLDYINLALKNRGDNGGLAEFPINKQSMETFFQNDYLAHEKYNPTDTVNVLNRFVSLISSFTLLKDKQETLLKKDILNHIRSHRGHTIKKAKLSKRYSSDMILYETEVSDVLSYVLTKQQYKELKEKMLYYNAKRITYLNQLYTVFPSLYEEKESSLLDARLKQAADIFLKGIVLKHKTKK